MPRCSLALADDHELVARGLATLLAPHHDITAVVHSGAELLGFLRRQRVDCVLLDLSMPRQSGLDVLPQLRRRWPNLKILILTMHVDRQLVDTTLSLGADGYVPKDAALPELLGAIDTVMAGGQYISPQIPKHTERTSLHALHPALGSLTPQQQRILLLLGEGLSSAAIGKTIGLSESTITFHRANLRRKLGIENELGLYRFAVLMRTMVPASSESEGGLP
jgi:DNA-binding NarL/FixJ family response regulator